MKDDGIGILGGKRFPIESPFDCSALSRFVSRVVERLRANGIIPVVVMRLDERLPAGSAPRFPLVAGSLSPAGEAVAIMAAAVRGKG
jgi:hypothetical protein